MRIAFAGTPPFAARALEAILGAASAHGWTVPLVLSQPDRPAGRGLNTVPSAVKSLALAHGIPVVTPASLRKGDEAAAAKQRLTETEPDVLVVAAYGLILPPDVLALPKGLRHDFAAPLTAINIHASLLPRWRGAAPVARAIEAGDTTTGITIMQMDAGLDTGPMLLAEPCAIEPAATTATLTIALARLGAQLIVDALARVGTLTCTSQPGGATYAAKIDKREAWLDWTLDAGALARKLRAFDPFPVAATMVRATPVKLWRGAAEASGARAEPGTVIAADARGVLVACGDGALRVTELQRAGGRRLGARDFLAGFAVAPGERCGRPPAE
jgi:methionyl-tRNA formyltransferase